MLSCFSHFWLCVTPWAGRPLGCFVLVIIQAGILEWVTMSSSRGSSQTRDQTHDSYVSCIGRQVLYHKRHLGSPRLHSQFSTVHQSCMTLCDPMDCSTPGFPVHHLLPEPLTMPKPLIVWITTNWKILKGSVLRRHYYYVHFSGEEIEIWYWTGGYLITF